MYIQVFTVHKVLIHYSMYVLTPAIIANNIENGTHEKARGIMSARLHFTNREAASRNVRVVYYLFIIYTQYKYSIS